MPEVPKSLIRKKKTVKRTSTLGKIMFGSSQFASKVPVSIKQYH